MKNILIGMLASTLILLVLTFGWGYNQYQDINNYEVYVENQVHRMFYNLVADVENIQSNLSKVLVTGTPKQKVLVLADLMHRSYNAQERLTQLPISHKEVSKTQKFLSQVGDLSMALARKNLAGKPLTQDDLNKIEQLHNYANYLSENLLKLEQDIKKNGNKIGEIVIKSQERLGKSNENMLNTSFLNVEERMQEYPELIYDGPFSEHIRKMKAKLTGEEISEDKARKIAEQFLREGKKYSSKIISETDNTELAAYIIELGDTDDNEEGNITMAVTKKGGKLLWLLNTKSIGEQKISKKQAINIAEDFLKKIDFNNMVATYSEEYDGQIVTNFAYEDNDVIIYTDLIKVKVSLDDGSIVGFEAAGYLSNHHERNIPKPEISEEDARNMISINADIEKARLAIIPTEGSKEVLCYEFLTKYKEDNFLIYINALNGEEEKILQMIVKEEGVLMM